MTTATATHPKKGLDPTMLVGEMVHYRRGEHCWAAAIVDSAPKDSVQLYLLPLPPSFPMPSSPGTFIDHDASRREETWHRLEECRVGAARPRRRTRRSGG
jgi:hypothetical protein